jgi:hypothetical protein
MARAATTIFPGSPTFEPFEELLLPPSAVRRQLDPAAGCGPACLEMVLQLEAGTDHPLPGQDQASLARRGQAFRSGDDRLLSGAWATSPLGLMHTLNAHNPPDPWHPPGTQQYHIVHAADAAGPVAEVLGWLQGRSAAATTIRRPSLLLMRRGTHWMLAAGARVQADGLAWLAVADPAEGRLFGLTAAGVLDEFTANAIGQHPDWTARWLALVPSVLPRRAPPVADAPTPTTVPVPVPDGRTAGHAPDEDPKASDPILDASRHPSIRAGAPGSWLTPSEESDIVDTLRSLAAQARHPRAVAWLAPLSEARHLTVPAPAGLAAPPQRPTSSRLVHAADRDGRPVAELLLRGSPATLTRFVVVARSPHPVAQPPPAGGSDDDSRSSCHRAR